MIGFLLAALALTACTLLFIVPPLLRKDDDAVLVVRDDLNLAVLRDQLRELDADLAAGMIDAGAYDSARQELERRVTEEVGVQLPAGQARTAARWTSLGLVLAVPLLASMLYIVLGSPLALETLRESPHAASPQPINAMVTSLAERLKQQPDDIDGWHMLARSYNALERYQEASAAYAHLLTKTPNDADLLADYADTLAMLLNQSLQGEPEKLIDRALALEPGHIKALALSGSAAFERRDYAGALARWQKIIDVAPPESEVARTTAASMSQARNLMAQAPQPKTLAASDATPKPATVSAGRLEGVVELDPAVRRQVAATDTVFIYARAHDGPRFPLAVLRKQVKDLPVAFVLDDSMAMMPGVKLSDFDSVLVGARISSSGSATARPGEPEASINAVPRGAKNLRLRIGESGSRATPGTPAMSGQ